MSETQFSGSISTRLKRIAEMAKRSPGKAFVSLNHHIDLELLKQAYRRTRKDGAVGVDGQTAEEYAERLEDNLRSLLERAKSGSYRAPPVRRVHIPKGNGKETRPLGIPTFEDKVLQRAVAIVLEPIYEQDFLDCSYGFRPGRNAHQALSEVWNRTRWTAGGWILELDIRKYFDTLDHERLREIVSHRVRDGVIVRLIGKWLKAGVLERGNLSYPGAGTPQGGVISPMLANIYLHEVLDVWFEEMVKPRMYGQAYLVRYADDAVLLFQYERDARRVMAVLPKRFEKYGLALHPDKTRLLPFRRPDRDRLGENGGRKPATFDFLGFTHFWEKSRTGKWVVRQRTAKGRFRRALATTVQWIKRSRHWTLREQHEGLSLRLRGHYGYFGIKGNVNCTLKFRRRVVAAWRKSLSRRSQRARMTWTRMNRLLQRYPLPVPQALSPA